MGEEVLHTYGLLGNAALLQTYGFVEERFYVLGLEENEGAYPHPYDFVRLPVELLLEVVPHALQSVAVIHGKQGAKWLSVVWQTLMHACGGGSAPSRHCL